MKDKKKKNDGSFDEVMRRLAELTVGETAQAGPTQERAEGYFEELGRQVEEGTMSKAELQKAIKQWQESGMSGFGEEYRKDPDQSRRDAAGKAGMASERAKMKKLLGEDYPEEEEESDF